MDERELKKRTRDFAHRCVKLALALPNSVLEQHVSRQLIRCSTSVPANYRATCLAQSKASFTAKLSIVLEETDESAFWLEFIIDEQIMEKENVISLLNEANELVSIFYASRKTAKK